MLQVEEVSKGYEGKIADEERTNMNVAIEKGEFVGVMGRSGRDKTRLLSLIATIDEPTTGQILIEGNNTYQLNPNELAKFRRQALGFVFQDYNLLETLTVKENIVLPLTLDGEKVNDMEEKAERIAHTLNRSEEHTSELQ